MKRVCTESKRNAHAPDFHCDLKAGHGEPHRDPLTGLRWQHPRVPYGMRSPKKPPMGHAKTKPGVSWSDRPVVGYNNGKGVA